MACVLGFCDDDDPRAGLWSFPHGRGAARPGAERSRPMPTPPTGVYVAVMPISNIPTNARNRLSSIRESFRKPSAYQQFDEAIEPSARGSPAGSVAGSQRASNAAAPVAGSPAGSVAGSQRA